MAQSESAQSQSAQSQSALRLVWIYPDLLSTYGDRGNLLVLARRSQLRGIPVQIAQVNSDQRIPTDGDIYLLGGGEDLPQILAARRLSSDGGLTKAASRGAVVFAVCAGYQIVGTEFGGVEGEPVAGLGLIDLRSGRGDRRGVGEITADVDPELGVERLTGFENHQGVTRRGPGVKPLATVLNGAVGNGDGTEGAHAGHILGTYLHGPALVRNPSLADLLLSWATGAALPAIDPRQERLVTDLRRERLARVLHQNKRWYFPSRHTSQSRFAFHPLLKAFHPTVNRRPGQTRLLLAGTGEKHPQGPPGPALDVNYSVVRT
jgi:CobQ-like glutamine amidotransferase family enzyme